MWVAPDVVLSRQAIDDMTRQMTGAPIHAPADEPRQRPLIVNSFSEHLAGVAVHEPPLRLAEIAMGRADALDALGLGSQSVAYLRSRLSAMSNADFDSLVEAVFHAGKATLDRLRHNATLAEHPTALWAPSGDARRLVGQTLLWADHYLVADEVAEHLLRHPDPQRAPEAAEALAREAQLRVLLDAGAIALVPEEVTQVLAADAAYAATEADLERSDLVAWVMSQLQISGPTAREVIFVDAIDANDLGQMYFYAHIDEVDDDGIVTTSALGHRYDPSYDYGPWIEQTRRQVAARRIQEMNFELAVADALGGQFIATSPFHARLLAHKGAVTTPAQGLIWADVPALPNADPDTLVRIAAEDETVQALRSTVRRGMSVASGGAQLAAAAEIAQQLREDATVLQRTIARDRVWKVVAPAVTGMAGLGIGAVAGGPLGAAAAALALAGGLAPAIADHGARKDQAAFAVYLASRRRRDRT